MNTITVKKEENIFLESESMRIKIDPAMNMEVSLLAGNEIRTIAGSDPGLPTHYIIVEGKAVRNFELNLNMIYESELSAELGQGKRVVISGDDSKSLGVTVRKTIQIEFYEAFPNTAYVTVSYVLIGSDKVFAIEKVVDNHFLVSRSQAGSEEIWSYQGSGETREHCVMPVTSEFYKENYSGVLESGDGGGSRKDYRTGSKPGFGGGVPINYVWGAKAGFVWGHIEDKYKFCYLPVVSKKGENHIDVALFHKPSEMLKKHFSYRSYRTVMGTYQGDYFHPLRDYSEVLSKMYGWNFSQGNDGAHSGHWCSWGYYADFKPEDVYSCLPSLKEIGIKWVVLDDRWFDNNGDWMPRKDYYPTEQHWKDFIQKIHDEGFKVLIWTIPGEVDGKADVEQWMKEHPGAAIEISKHPYHEVSQIALKHPEWCIVDKNGEKELTKRGNYFTCPTVKEVQDYFVKLTEKMLIDWKVDGFKQDATYVMPACYEPSHMHKHPDEGGAYEEIMKVIYETTMRINPEAVIENCPCGTPPTFTWLRYQNQGATADPMNPWVLRTYHRQMKALRGPTSAVFSDHIEQICPHGEKFAHQIGIGGIPGVRYTSTGRDEVSRAFNDGPLAKNNDYLTTEKIALLKKWFGMYDRMRLSKGEYLGLYDIQFDKPECHVIRKDGKMYYAFYSDDKDFSGKVVFRGLQNKTYKVFDYVNEKELGTVNGPEGVLDVKFADHLLVVLS